jgi:hypothetical protein
MDEMDEMDLMDETDGRGILPAGGAFTKQQMPGSRGRSPATG